MNNQEGESSSSNPIYYHKHTLPKGNDEGSKNPEQPESSSEEEDLSTLPEIRLRGCYYQLPDGKYQKVSYDLNDKSGSNLKAFLEYKKKVKVNIDGEIYMASHVSKATMSEPGDVTVRTPIKNTVVTQHLPFHDTEDVTFKAQNKIATGMYADFKALIKSPASEMDKKTPEQIKIKFNKLVDKVD
jgi:hypothetical protein